MEELRAQRKAFELATTGLRLATEAFEAELEGFNASTSWWKARTSRRKVPESCCETPEPVGKAPGKTCKAVGGCLNGSRAVQKPPTSKLERRSLKRKGAARLGRRDGKRRRMASATRRVVTFQEALLLVRRFTAGTSSSRSTWRSASRVTGADSGATAARRAALIRVW